jgi:hypothetical protein
MLAARFEQSLVSQVSPKTRGNLPSLSFGGSATMSWSRHSPSECGDDGIAQVHAITAVTVLIRDVGRIGITEFQGQLRQRDLVSQSRR